MGKRSYLSPGCEEPFVLKQDHKLLTAMGYCIWDNTITSSTAKCQNLNSILGGGKYTTGGFIASTYFCFCIHWSFPKNMRRQWSSTHPNEERRYSLPFIILCILRCVKKCWAQHVWIHHLSFCTSASVLECASWSYTFPKWSLTAIISYLEWSICTCPDDISVRTILRAENCLVTCTHAHLRSKEHNILLMRDVMLTVASS